jgi:serine protease inhibitor ecotin
MLVTLEKGPNFAAVLGGGLHFYTATELEGWGWDHYNHDNFNGTLAALTIKEATPGSYMIHG